MQTKEIILNLKPSKIPLFAITLIFVLAILTMHYLPKLKVGLWIIIAVISIYWLYKYLTYPFYQININTHSHNFQIHSTQSFFKPAGVNTKNTAHADSNTANLIQVKSIVWWITIVKLAVVIDQKVKKITIPVFMDSIPLKQYKTFRMFILWQ